MNPQALPQVAKWLLERLLPEKDRNTIVGDLIEESALRARTSTRIATAWWCWGQVARSIPLGTVVRLSTRPLARYSGRGNRSVCLRQRHRIREHGRYLENVSSGRSVGHRSQRHRWSGDDGARRICCGRDSSRRRAGSGRNHPHSYRSAVRDNAEQRSILVRADIPHRWTASGARGWTVESHSWDWPDSWSRVEKSMDAEQQAVRRVVALFVWARRIVRATQRSQAVSRRRLRMIC